MTGWAWWRQVMLKHPHLVDSLAAVLLFVGPLIARVASRGAGRGPDFVLTSATIFVGAIACATLVVRRRWPLPVLAITAIAASAAIVLTDGRSPYVAPAVVAAYTAATLIPRARAWTAAAIAAALVAGTSMAVVPGPLLGPENVGLVTWIGMAVAVGDAVRSRRAYVHEVEERAKRAEQSREEEAARRVVDERLRIARELHDVVAHHIALINVQAGVATHMLREQPDATAVALGHIRDASRSVLSELSTLLGVLRENDEPVAVTEPAPSLARLAELVDKFAGAGLGIELVTTGRPRPVPAAVDLAAYRIVQESLTNAHKHGRGAGVTVMIGHAPGRLRIEVRTAAPVIDAPANGVQGSGHGIVGMRERATTVGGTLRAEPVAGGGFGVVATLPLPPDATPEDA